jgi:hypothetical protein
MQRGEAISNLKFQTGTNGKSASLKATTTRARVANREAGTACRAPTKKNNY